MIDVEYDLAAARLYDSANPYVRYFDLLPLEDPANVPPFEHPVTPTRHARRLGERLGLERLYLKDETVLPTRTTKDRMAAVVLSFLQETKVRRFATSSTGNSSTALARHIRHYPGCRMYVFSAEDFLERLQFAQSDQVVVFALRGASFAEAAETAAAFALRAGITSESGFFNPARREGLKLAFLEAAEAVPGTIDWYVQAVSSAMGVYGACKGAKELAAMGRISRPPRLLCVQQDTCCPMVKAFADGAEAIRPRDIVRQPRGIAHAILRGDPTREYPYVRRIVNESGGTMTAVSEDQIRRARRMVEELEGLSPCCTAATAVAGLAKMVEARVVAAGQTVLVNLTGADRPASPPPRNVHWLERTATGWRPADGTSSLPAELQEALA
jgi:threonine synthase